MQKVTAKLLTDLLLRHSGEQNDILKAILLMEPAEEYARIKTMIGKSMGCIYLDLLYPILEEYPDLKPAQLQNTSDKTQP